MSGKGLVFIALIAAGGYALQRHTPPNVEQAGVGGRLSYGVGRVGSKMIGGWVTGMVTGTEQSLADMKGSIKRTPGGDGTRARDFARKAVVMDSTASVDLALGRPISALKNAMDAKSMLNAVRQQVQRNI